MPWATILGFALGAALGWAVRGAGARLEFEAARLRWEREQEEQEEQS